MLDTVVFKYSRVKFSRISHSQAISLLLMCCDGDMVQSSFLLRSRRSASLSRTRYSLVSFRVPVAFLALRRMPLERGPDVLLPSSEEQPSPMEHRLEHTFSRSDALPRLVTDKEGIHTPQLARTKRMTAKGHICCKILG